MKKLLIVLVFAFFGITCYCQTGANNKFFEKHSEKYSVKTVTILGQIFNVGDTITVLSGSNANGDFLSLSFSALPDIPGGASVSLFGEFTPPPVPSNFTGRKLIILKIFSASDGLNTFDKFVCDLGNKVHIYIDPLLGLTRKEIK